MLCGPCTTSPARAPHADAYAEVASRWWGITAEACEAADKSARRAAQTGDKYQALLNDGLRYDSNED